MNPASPPSKPPVEISASRHFLGWLAEQQISLAFTTYQTCRLFLLGVKPNGQFSGFERLFDRAMGLWATPERLYMSSRYQLWRFDNVLAAGQEHNGYDKLYIPRVGYTTGDLDIHDIVVISPPSIPPGGGEVSSVNLSSPVPPRGENLSQSPPLGG